MRVIRFGGNKKNRNNLVNHAGIVEKGGKIHLMNMKLDAVIFSCDTEKELLNKFSCCEYEILYV